MGLKIIFHNLSQSEFINSQTDKEKDHCFGDIYCRNHKGEVIVPSIVGSGDGYEEIHGWLGFGKLNGFEIRWSNERCNM